MWEAYGYQGIDFIPLTMNSIVDGEKFTRLNPFKSLHDQWCLEWKAQHHAVCGGQRKNH